VEFRDVATSIPGTYPTFQAFLFPPRGFYASSRDVITYRRPSGGRHERKGIKLVLYCSLCAPWGEITRQPNPPRVSAPRRLLRDVDAFADSSRVGRVGRRRGRRGRRGPGELRVRSRSIVGISPSRREFAAPMSRVHQSSDFRYRIHAAARLSPT